jgi:hypothetical protein
MLPEEAARWREAQGKDGEIDSPNDEGRGEA